MRPLLSLLLFPVLLGVASADPAILVSEFIYESGPYPQIHATTIEETPEGMIAAWFGGTKEKHPDVGIWVSRQVDGKWTPGVEVANGIQYTLPDGTAVRHPTWNPVLFQPREGPLLLFYKAGPTPQTWWGMLTTSTDHGKTWSTPRRLPEGILGPVKNRPLQLPDGTIVCPTSEETEDKPSKWTVHFERTRDLGITWQRTPALHDGIAIQAIQPSLLTRKDGSLLAIGRTRQDHLFSLSSTDQGVTWSPIKLGTLPNNNSGTDAVTLQDGSHLLVYNHVTRLPGKWSGIRTPLNVSVSQDGETWKAALVIEKDPGEYSYPSVMQAKDGKVHITYTWKRQRVKHLVIDPAKLQPKDMAADGCWPQ